MGLWLVMTILCSAAAVGVAIPLIRRYENVNIDRFDNAIYEDQLKEVERDFHNGSINAPEADSAKIEIQRRLAKLERTIVEAKPISPTWRNVALLVSSGLVILGSVILYSRLGSPDLPSAVSRPTGAVSPQAETARPQGDAIVAKLTARLQSNPKDAEGWRMLGWAQFNRQHYPESADAYAKALALQTENTDYKSAYAEALVQVSQGIVTPKAMTLFKEVLAKDPKDSRGRFYDALSHEQSGDQLGALDRWLALLADTPPDAGWRDNVKQRIADLAKATGRDVSAALAAPETDQQNMIRSMVERLAGKLAANPNDAEGWVRLMQSYQVLGETAKAKAALSTALLTFTNDAVMTARIKSAAVDLGVN